LILRKIIKIVANRCHGFSLKCTKFDFRWGSGELTALPGTPSWISGVLLLTEGTGKRREMGKDEGRGEKGRDGRGGG